MRRRHVALDLGDHAPLRPGEARRAGRREPRRLRAGTGNAMPGSSATCACGAPGRAGERRARRRRSRGAPARCRRSARRRRPRGGVVHVAKRPARSMMPRRAATRRKRARHARPRSRPRRVDEPSHRADRDAGRLGVDRHDAAELVLGALEQLDLRVNHLPPAVAGFDLAVQNDSRTGLSGCSKYRSDGTRERQSAPPSIAVASRMRRRRRPAKRSRRRRSRPTVASDPGRASRSASATAVLVAERQMEEQIVDRREAERRELLGALRSDALHELHRRGEQCERGLRSSPSPHKAWRVRAMLQTPISRCPATARRGLTSSAASGKSATSGGSRSSAPRSALPSSAARSMSSKILAVGSAFGASRLGPSTARSAVAADACAAAGRRGNAACRHGPAVSVRRDDEVDDGPTDGDRLDRHPVPLGDRRGHFGQPASDRGLSRCLWIQRDVDLEMALLDQLVVMVRQGGAADSVATRYRDQFSVVRSRMSKAGTR